MRGKFSKALMADFNHGMIAKRKLNMYLTFVAGVPISELYLQRQMGLGTVRSLTPVFNIHFTNPSQKGKSKR